MSENLVIDSPIDQKTLAEAARERIKLAILQGRFAPGEKLDQAVLARAYGISRMPVRDALRALEHDGFVTLDARRGASVVDVDPNVMEQVYEIREVIEALAAKKAAPRITDEDLESLTELSEQMEEANLAGQTARFLQLDHDFHLAAYRACENAPLLRIIGDLINSTWIYRIAATREARERAVYQSQHGAIIDALVARDSRLASRLVKQHLRETERIIGRVTQGEPSEL